jgi:hypothetical protein
MTRLLSAISVAAPAPARPLTLPTAAVRAWLVRQREPLWLAAILLVAALAHGINMFHFPYYEDDEGTYMSQAWAVLHLGQLAPYTYWYDHAPGGWLQIALWAIFTGGFHTFGNTVETGRVFMLVLQVASTGLVYGIARRISGNVAVGTVAALIFALSAYGTYFHRRVLLDNLTTPWMLLSIFVLLSPRLTLAKIWLSALALGISILSKELTAFMVPPMAYLVYCRAHPSQRAFGIIGWLSVVLGLVSLYPLMALLKGEMFPQYSLLGGTAPHVSLISTLQYQAGRGSDGGLRNPHSQFWLLARVWMQDEPLLEFGGSLCALISVLLIWRYRLVGVLGMITFSLWAFIGRGGEVIEFYLVPLLPLLAINVALVLWIYLENLARIRRLLGWPLVRLAQLAAVLACLAGIAGGYLTPHRGFAGDHLLLWNATQADAQTQALAWIEAHVPRIDSVISDNYLYTDLHDGSAPAGAYNYDDYYWKLDRDPAIGGTRYHDKWQNVDYLMTTIQVLTDYNEAKLPLTGALLQHSVVVAHYDTGGWPVEIRQVIKPGHPAPHNSLPVGTQFYFAGGENSTTAHTSLFLRNPDIYPASVAITFYFPNGTTDVQRVDVDPSSDRQVDVAGIERTSGPFGMMVQASRPVAAHLTIHRDGTAGDSLIVDQGLATHWSLTEDYSGMIGRETLALLNPDPALTAHVTLRTVALSGTASPVRTIAVPPHRSMRIPLVPIEARDVEVQSDRPIAAERTVQFSAAGYKLMAGGRGAEQTGWLFATGPGSATLTFYNPGCVAAVAVAPSGGRQLVASSCRDARLLSRFLQAGALTAPTPVPVTSAAGSDSPPGG